MEEKKDQPISLDWDFNIPLYNRFIMLDLFKALCIPFLLIAGFVVWSAYSVTEHGGTVSFYGLNYALIFIGICFVVTILMLWLIYQNRFESHFVINENGVSVAYRGGTSKKNKKVNTLLIVLGAFAGKPGYAGTGLMAQSMQSVSVEWNEIFKVAAFPRNYAIALRNNWREVMIVYCTKENYSQALDIINTEVNKRKTDRVVDLKSIRKEHIFSWIMTPIVLIFGFFLSAVYEYDFDSKIFMFLVAGWVLLTVWVPTALKKLTSGIGIILTLIYWVWGILAINEGYFISDDWIRVIFLSLGCLGLIVVCILNYRRE